jgi:polysaccharide export outer membrane protein
MVQSKTYYMLGAVQLPGQYPIFRETDVRMALALAGGTTPTGVMNRAYLSRDGRVYFIDIRSMLMNAVSPFWLCKGDILYIPDIQDRRVYVLGYVNSPGAIDVASSGLDILAAISEAGDFQAGARRDQVAVIRRIGHRLIGYVVDVDALLRGKSADLTGMALQPGDIIYVSMTGLASWNRIIMQISPTFNALLFEPVRAVRDYFLIREIINRK